MKLLIVFLFFPVLLFSAEQLTVTSSSSKNVDHTAAVSSSSNTKYEGLYDNGPLGWGFVPKDKKAQQREETLHKTREMHDQVIQFGQKLFELEKIEEYHRKFMALIEEEELVKIDLFFCGDVVEQLKSDLQQQLNINQVNGIKEIEYLISKRLDNIHNRNEEIRKMRQLSQNIKDSVNIRLNPVIVKINSGEKQLGSAQLYSLLHSLRQKFYENASENVRVELNKNELPSFFVKVIHENPDGIQAEYTDGQQLFIYWDKEKNNIIYCSGSLNEVIPIIQQIKHLSDDSLTDFCIIS